jgi:putative pyruvate formate lyase activating enzyme
LIISSIFPHHGEEPPISGTSGSGTVFFSYCTLKCCFCQNYQISHEFEGRSYSISEFAQKMLHLQELGCHNINLVTATHFLPWILRSLKEASQMGLHIPIVYNCGGYELSSTIAHLSGIIDIYLPDMKYGCNEEAALFSKAPDYVEINKQAVREMFKQTGPLKTDTDGIAYRGLCIRHLILPENLSRTDLIQEFLQTTFDPSDVFISLMAQYRPLYKSDKFKALNQGITEELYEKFKRAFIDAGFECFYQEYRKMDTEFIIDFKERKEERLTGKPAQ